MTSKRRDQAVGATAAAGAFTAGSGAYGLVNTRKKSVGISYGYSGTYRGHLSHAEDIASLLKAHGIKSELYESQNPKKIFSPHRVAIDTGFGGPLGFGPFGPKKLPYELDYQNAHDPAQVTVPGAIAKAKRAGRKTLGVYGGGGGADVHNKIPVLAALHDKFDAIHVYAGPKGHIAGRYETGGYESAVAEVEKLRASNPEAAAKFKVHGLMHRKAIKNAVRTHAVNIGNAASSTMHEIATSERPGLIWQSGVRPYSDQHLKPGEQWSHAHGIRTAVGETPAARNASALEHLRNILKDPTAAATEQKRVGQALVDAGAKSREAFVKSVKEAMASQPKHQRRIGAALVGGGAAISGAAYLLRNKKTRQPVEFARGEQLLNKIPELSGRRLWGTVHPDLVPIAKAVIKERQWSRPQSLVHHKWVSEIADMLRKRRGEFKQYKRAITDLEAILDVTQFDKKEKEKKYRPIAGTVGAAVIPGVGNLTVGAGTLAAMYDWKSSSSVARPSHSAQTNAVLEALGKEAQKHGAKVHDSQNILVPGAAWHHDRFTTASMRAKVKTMSGSGAKKGVMIHPGVKTGLRPGIIAHEIGHLEQSGLLRNPILRAAGPIGSIGGSLLATYSRDERQAKIAALVGGAAFLPTMASEIDASVRGAKILGRSGVKGFGKKLAPFVGLTSYAAMGATPYAAYRIKKAIGGYKKPE